MATQLASQWPSKQPFAESDCGEATINYVAPMAERPTFHAQDHRRDNLRYDSHRVTIRNARSLRDPPTLEREGLTLVRHASAMRDLRDPDEVRRVYAREVEKFMIELTGGTRAVMLGGGGVFRGYDNDATWRAGVPHSAFDDPSCPPGGPARVSIEARVFVVYE